MKLILLGMNHRTAPIDVRERMAVDEPGPLLQKLVASDEIDVAVLFSTCNRVEVLALTRTLDGARIRLRSFFQRDLASDDFSIGEDLDELTYEYRDSEAIIHVLRVASALDSMVVGNPKSWARSKIPTAPPRNAVRAGRSSAGCCNRPSRRPSG